MTHQGTIAGIAWHLAPCLETLIGQMPGVTFGVIGDAAHIREGRPVYSKTTGHTFSGTDHLPDDNGAVCAVDAMGDQTDLGLFLAASNDPRLAYLEFENLPRWPHLKMQCNPGGQPFPVGPSSAGPHVHVSVLHLPTFTDDRSPWTITDKPIPSEDDMPLNDIDKAWITQTVHDALAKALAAHTLNDDLTDGPATDGALPGILRRGAKAALQMQRDAKPSS